MALDGMAWARLAARLLLLLLGVQPGSCLGAQSRKLLGGGDGQITAQISDGLPVSAGRYPFMAALFAKTPIDPYNNLYQYCGGSLIAPGFVLTAGHCTYWPNGLDRQPAYVRVGMVDATDASVPTRGVAKMIRHPLYAPGNNANDVALLVLNETVAGVALAQVANATTVLEAGQPLNVIGFGSTPSSLLSKALLQTTVSLVSREECQAYYSKWNLMVPNTTICAGSKSTSDACTGDSGGPLLTQEGVVVGLVSFGPDNCGGDGHIGAYTDVASLQPWIVSVMKEEEKAKNGAPGASSEEEEGEGPTASPQLVAAAPGGTGGGE